VGVWPLLRAVPQRALLLLRTLLCAGTLSAAQSANKRMSHLAGFGREATALDDAIGVEPVRARIPWLVEGLRALTGSVSLKDRTRLRPTS
jgi:hypothetical protein